MKNLIFKCNFCKETEILPGTPFGPRACRGETDKLPGRCRSFQWFTPSKAVSFGE